MKRVVLIAVMFAAPVWAAQINVPNVAPAEALARIATRCVSRGFTIQEMTANMVVCSKPTNAGADFFAALALGGTGGQGYQSVIRAIVFGTPQMSSVQYTATIEGQGPYGQKKVMPMATSGKGGVDESMAQVFPESGAQASAAPAPVVQMPADQAAEQELDQRMAAPSLLPQ